MAMNHGSMLSFQQTLGNGDCDPAIGELVLSGGVARLFAPCSRDCHFVYEATLVFYDGCPAAVRVFKAAAGRETVLREGWNAIRADFNLLPGNIAVFTQTSHHGTFTANFLNGFNRAALQRRGIPYQPPPVHQGSFARTPPRTLAPLNMGALRALAAAQVGQGVQAAGAAAGGGVQAAAQAGRGVHPAGAAGGGGVQAAAQAGLGVHPAGAAAGGGVQAAGAAAGGSRAMQGDDMAIRQAMDLAVECGAEEGSDEHYMATKLFVKAENRAVFLSFKSNKKRLRWLRRCYTDGWTG